MLTVIFIYTCFLVVKNIQLLRDYQGKTLHSQSQTMFISMHIVRDNARILSPRFAKVLLSSYPTRMVCYQILLHFLTLQQQQQLIPNRYGLL